MAESTAGEIVVGCESPATPKRPTRLVKPTAKVKEMTRSIDETAVRVARRPAIQTTRASSNETDLEDRENVKKDGSNGATEKTLLLRVLEELKNLKDASVKQQELICNLKDASVKQQELICNLQEQVAETQQEIRETKDELKHVRERLEAVTAAAATQSSPRASYAEVARTPPSSLPSNIRSLPSTDTDTHYCTVDVSRVEGSESDDTSAGAIRRLIEAEIQAKLSQPSWRCRAVTLDRKSPHRIRIACRDEREHRLVKQVAEAKVPRGARILRDELYPVKVDNVNRLAVLDELGDTRAGVAEAFGRENDVQVAKVAWLSKRDAPKAYGSMVVYMTKASDAKKVLHEGFFYAGGESGYTGPFERRPRPEQCYNCQEIGHKAFQCSKAQVCGKCAREGHHHSRCSELIPKCALCDGPHEAFSRTCRKLFPALHE